MPIPTQGDESFVDLHFPSAGVDISAAFSAQPNRPVQGGVYARTTVAAVNVRGYEALTQRCRGGSRPGLSKYIPVLVADFIIQELTTIVTVSQAAKS